MQSGNSSSLSAKSRISVQYKIAFLADTGTKLEPADHAYAGMRGLKQPPFADFLQLCNVSHRHSQRGIAILVLVGAGGVVDDRAARARL